MISPAKIPTGAWRRSNRPRALFVLLTLSIAACASPPSPPAAAPGPSTGRLDPSTRLETQTIETQPVLFSQVPGWSRIDARGALNAFVNSCMRIEDRPDNAPMNPRASYAGRAGDWRDACLRAAMLADRPLDVARARDFFERHFTPIKIHQEGHLTGYYEPVVEVRHTPDREFSMAIRGAPPDLLTGDLGRFIAELEGQRIMGRAVDRSFMPYNTRAEIEAKNLGAPLAWGRPIDVFFLQIQGSARLSYPDGSASRVRFAAHNGLPYVSIGRLLIERGELSEHNASKQDIEAWLRVRGPEAWRPLFNENPRYVFFSLDSLDNPQEGPIGAQGAPLTPMASLAVDPGHHAWGVPVVVQAALHGEPDWTGLVVTQDAGGAILGPVRGDLFFGWGDDAGERAGRQNDPRVRWTLLLPHVLAEAQAR